MFLRRREKYIVLGQILGDFTGFFPKTSLRRLPGGKALALSRSKN
jgi:hypothetical protein